MVGFEAQGNSWPILRASCSRPALSSVPMPRVTAARAVTRYSEPGVEAQVSPAGGKALAKVPLPGGRAIDGDDRGSDLGGAGDLEQGFEVIRGRFCPRSGGSSIRTEVVWPGLRRQRTEGRQREAHGHAMVVVGGCCRAAKRRPVA